jgi:hypothetical protein
VRRRAYEVLGVVAWCGHLQELILVPEELNTCRACRR